MRKEVEEQKSLDYAEASQKVIKKTMVIKSYTIAKILRYKMDSKHKLNLLFCDILTYYLWGLKFCDFFYKPNRSIIAFLLWCVYCLYLQLVKGKTFINKNKSLKKMSLANIHIVFCFSHVSSRAVKINQNVNPHKITLQFT